MRASAPLSGRVALVTGANHGIGAAIALALAALGADVMITYLRMTEDAGATEPPAYAQQRGRDAGAVVAAIEGAGRRAVAAESDLADPTLIPPLFDRAERELGPVSVLVHNASGWKKDSFSVAGTDRVGRPDHPVTLETIAGPLHVDARAGALLMADYIARHRARGDDWGRIVTMTSGDGRAFPGEVSYGAAKAALASYTLSAASEMAGDGVTANVVYPPVTDTGWITDEVRAFVAADADHHHVAAPAEVAEVVAWLCTPAARLVSGNVVRLR
jgi:3-oxoacyl-[acyl-carrier protein] reductase